MTEVSRQTDWYAIHTKPSAELLAEFNIERLAVPVFFPKVQQVKRVFGVRKQVMKPLFPGYIFARFCPFKYLHLIHYARGVRRVVGAGEVPVPVDKEIIDLLRSRQANRGYVSLGTKQPETGDRVVVTKEGPLQGLNGIFEHELDDQQRVSILLEAIHYRPRMVIEKCYLQAAKV